MAGIVNPRGEAYAVSEGFETFDEVMDRDAARYPGGKMAGYLDWIAARWKEWAVETGHPRARHHTAPLTFEDRDRFDAWIVARYLRPT